MNYVFGLLVLVSQTSNIINCFNDSHKNHPLDIILLDQNVSIHEFMMILSDAFISPTAADNSFHIDYIVKHQLITDTLKFYNYVMATS